MTVAQQKARALRARLDVRKPALAMAAHNPLAAKLAVNAGFDAIWGSGFELSASYAVPDANILSMGIHLDMAYATAIRSAGGDADLLDLPDIGIKGNTHLVMMDRNSDQVAEVIQKWFERKGLVD